jgi:hypothetical protein
MDIAKDGAVPDLDDYRGSLGRIVIFSPDLHIYWANALPDADTTKQSGVMTFPVNFPGSGLNIAYVQTEDDDGTTTFDFAFDVRP